MRVGVLGAGQLGLMLAQAGRALDIECVFLDPNPEACARREGLLVVAEYTSASSLEQLCAVCDAMTYEFENVPIEAAARAEAGQTPLRPPAASLRSSQDRAQEKLLLQRVGFELAPWKEVPDADGLDAALHAVGMPGVLKTATGGYDGKGQLIVRSTDDVSDARSLIEQRRCVYEGLVAFDRELSLVACRGVDGTCVFWPLVENEHRDGILRSTIAPARGCERLQSDAEVLVRALLEELDHVGTLTVEFFESGGRLIANEFAPRVHNSGHWSIEGAATSQFENHLRAIVGSPLGPPDPRGHSAMLNLVGEIPDGLPAACDAIGATLHDYAKDPRPGRKVGHVTVVADDAATRDNLLARLSALQP